MSAVAAKKKKTLDEKGLQSPSKHSSPPQRTPPEKARPNNDRTLDFASGSKTVEGTKDRCTICLDSLASRECVELPCGHVYHQSCVKGLRQFGVNDLCPQCRARLPPGPTATRDEGIGRVSRRHVRGQQHDRACLHQ